MSHGYGLRPTELVRRGPAEGEDFFRLKMTGAGSTHFINCSPELAEVIATVIDGYDPGVVVDEVPAAIQFMIDFVSSWAACQDVARDELTGREAYSNLERLRAAIAGGIEALMFNPDYEVADALDMEEDPS